MLPHPLPLLPAEIFHRHTIPSVSRQSRYPSSSSAASVSFPSDSSHTSRSHGELALSDSYLGIERLCTVCGASVTMGSILPVDIREVPSEMPMYLLAEDEGNEEEILRLLESESPGGSPQTIQSSLTPDSNYYSSNDIHSGEQSPLAVSCMESSLNQESLKIDDQSALDSKSL